MKQEEYNKKSKTEKRQKYNFETSKIQTKKSKMEQQQQSETYLQLQDSQKFCS